MSASARRGPEPWALGAFVLGALTIAGMLVLGLRPGGALPIFVYTRGGPWLTVAAFLTFLGGGLWAASHQPFLQRRRLAAFAVLAVVVVVVSAPVPYPSSHEDSPSRARIELPVEGAWTVRWGGDRGASNPFVLTHDRRWSLHLVRVVDGATASGDADEPGAYHAFGSVVHAPADGVVARAHDGEPDGLGPVRPGGERYGNHVCLELGEDEYLFLSGLAQGSVEVSVGDRVVRGDRLGRVGSSAISPQTPEPYLCMHVQDDPEPARGEAVPWYLHHYRSGEREVERGRPKGGLRAGGAHVGEVVERVEEYYPIHYDDSD